MSPDQKKPDGGAHGSAPPKRSTLELHADKIVSLVQQDGPEENPMTDKKTDTTTPGHEVHDSNSETPPPLPSVLDSLAPEDIARIIRGESQPLRSELVRCPNCGAVYPMDQGKVQGGSEKDQQCVLCLHEFTLGDDNEAQATAQSETPPPVPSSNVPADNEKIQCPNCKTTFRSIEILLWDRNYKYVVCSHGFTIDNDTEAQATAQSETPPPPPLPLLIGDNAPGGKNVTCPNCDKVYSLDPADFVGGFPNVFQCALCNHCFTIDDETDAQDDTPPAIPTAQQRADRTGLTEPYKPLADIKDPDADTSTIRETMPSHPGQARRAESDHYTQDELPRVEDERETRQDLPVVTGDDQDTKPDMDVVKAEDLDEDDAAELEKDDGKEAEELPPPISSPMFSPELRKPNPGFQLPPHLEEVVRLSAASTPDSLASGDDDPFGDGGDPFAGPGTNPFAVDADDPFGAEVPFGPGDDLGMKDEDYGGPNDSVDDGDELPPVMPADSSKAAPKPSLITGSRPRFRPTGPVPSVHDQDDKSGPPPPRRQDHRKTIRVPRHRPTARPVPPPPPGPAPIRTPTPSGGSPIPASAPVSTPPPAASTTGPSAAPTQAAAAPPAQSQPPAPTGPVVGPTASSGSATTPVKTNKTVVWIIAILIVACLALNAFSVWQSRNIRKNVIAVLKHRAGIQKVIQAPMPKTKGEEK